MKNKKTKKLITWIKKTQLVIEELLGFLVLSVLVIIWAMLFLFSVIDLVNFLPILFNLVISLVAIYLVYIRQRKRLVFVCITSKYLLEKKENLDEILGILIGKKWNRIKIDPIHEFFNCLEHLCEGDDYDMKRRISEALPALFKMDLKSSKDLAKILRYDWNFKRWKSDNRRRVVESLATIIKKDKSFVSKYIKIIDNDEIFTIIAILEILNFWREKINEQEAIILYNQLIKDMNQFNYPSDQIEAIKRIWDIFRYMSLNKGQIIDYFERYKNHSNIFIQITLARNIAYYCKRFSDNVFDLMNFFLENDKHKNVRRPIAKEGNVDWVVKNLKKKKNKKKARALLRKLISDKDYIIRNTTFDKIEKILDIDNIFGIELVKYVVKNEKEEVLKQRAELIYERISK